MNLTIKYYQGIFIRYATLLAIFMVLRWAFYIYNQSLFSVHSFSEVINVFTGGLIYDFSTLMYSNIILIFLEVFPFPLVKFSVVRKTHRILFTFVNGILLSLICADIVFYQFNGKRIDLELIGLLGAIPALIGSFINEFWYIFILFSILIYFLFRLSKIHTDITSLPKLWVRILVFILSIGIAIIGMRGGVTNKRPLSTASASLHASMENISLVTNSAFTFFYSLANRNIEIPNYIEKQNLENVFPVEITYSNDSSGSQKPNIVLLIMESFSRSVVGSFSGNTSHTPYLDSIANKSTKYVNGFANGRRSSQALVSLISGIPALLPEPFMYSPSAGNKINGIPHQLKKIGYQSAFFNGSSKDKLGWERFINQVGFDQYLSKEDYPNPKHDDGEWGIFDHYMFDYLERVLDTTSNPAFYTLFSISSHHPFNIPDSLKSLFLSDEHKYYQALHYSDWSLGQFFEKSKKKKWFKNTIFIVVADHTLNGESFSQEHQKRAKNWYQNRVGLYSIPILFYNPNFEVSRTVTTPFSQVDVAASILEIAGYTGSTISWGTPTSALSYENYCFEFVNGIYQIHNEQHVVLFDGQNSLGIFDFMTDITFDNDLRNNENLSELHDLMLYKLKGAIQQHHARMVQNRLFVKE